MAQLSELGRGKLHPPLATRLVSNDVLPLGRCYGSYDRRKRIKISFLSGFE